MPATKAKPTAAPASHTAGPWAFKEGDAERMEMSDVYQAGDPEMRIAYVICEWRNPQARAMDLANARLIAAAPELLAACQAIAAADNDPEFYAAQEKARAAIAKAESR